MCCVELKNFLNLYLWFSMREQFVRMLTRANVEWNWSHLEGRFYQFTSKLAWNWFNNLERKFKKTILKVSAKKRTTKCDLIRLTEWLILNWEIFSIIERFSLFLCPPKIQNDVSKLRNCFIKIVLFCRHSVTFHSLWCAVMRWKRWRDRLDQRVGSRANS